MRGEGPRGERDGRGHRGAALERYQSTEQYSAALRMADVLIEATQEPEQLSKLWSVRGALIAATDPADEAVVDAFEMALSYDHNAQAALSGLADAYEARGDWDELNELLEPLTRSTDPSERAAVLRKLASIARAQGDLEKAAEELLKAVELEPSQADLEQLESLFSDDPDRLPDKLRMSAELLAYGGDVYQRALGIVQGLASLGDRRSAYSVASLLLRVSRHAPDDREMLHGLRREFERGSQNLDFGEEAREALRPPGLNDAFFGEVLVPLEMEMADLVQPPRTTKKIMAISASMSHGKLLAGLVEALGLEERTLYRSDGLEDAIQPCSGDTPGIAVRSEVMQRLVHQAGAFALSSGLEMSWPGRMLLGSMNSERRAELAHALWAACGLGDAPEGPASELAERIMDVIDADDLAEWAELLSGYGEPTEVVEQQYALALRHAQECAAALVGDLRQTVRAAGLMDPKVPQLKTLATPEALNEAVVSCAPLLQIVARGVRGSVLLALYNLGA